MLQENVKVGDFCELISCVNIGNPHCVLLKNNINEIMIKKIGPLFENINIFPKKTNVHIVKIINVSRFSMEVWERGVGYTLSSGTGAVASFLVCYRLGLVNNKVIVNMPGGEIEISLVKNDVFLTGIVHRVFYGMLSRDLKEIVITKQ